MKGKLRAHCSAENLSFQREKKKKRVIDFPSSVKAYCKEFSASKKDPDGPMMCLQEGL